MYKSQCNGSHWPSELPNYPVMRSSPSTGLASEARGESCSSRQPAVAASDREDLLKLNTFFPLPASDHQNPSGEKVNPGTIRRRASQGSLITKPSAVSRFLSKGNPRLQIPDFDRLGATIGSPRGESRVQFPDSAISLSPPSGTSNSQAIRETRPAWDAISKGFTPGDHYSALPPTPPDDDEHVAWNPRSGMLAFEAQMNHGPGPMDEGPNRESTSKGVPDSLGSPDLFSNPSTSIGGSQGSPGGPMDCDQNSWPL